MIDTSKAGIEAMIERLETTAFVRVSIEDSPNRYYPTTLTAEAALLLRALLAERKWRTMDSAPRVEDARILYEDDYGVQIAMWHIPWIGEDHIHPGEWVNNCTYAPVFPTRWRPLPTTETE